MTSDPVAARRRIPAEELGLLGARRQTRRPGEIRQSAGKVVTAYAVAARPDVTETHSNTVELEPRGSGRIREFPEVDRVGMGALGARPGQTARRRKPLSPTGCGEPGLNAPRAAPAVGAARSGNARTTGR